MISDGLIRVGFEVEGIISQGDSLIGPLKIGKVLTIEEIAEFKKPIRFVGLDCGEAEVRYVICGATNFTVGDLVVVALPGAILPGDFVIAARETYGKISNGMICSGRELGISEDHAGIIVLSPDSVSIGEDALSALQIVDVIFDVAVNPDRGYALSIRGIAREVAASLNLDFKDPIEEIKKISFDESGKGPDVIIDDPSGASVIYLRSLTEFNPKTPTPLWMSRRLEKMGMRSISFAVDVTNYVMLELGQPLHAFDSAKITGSLHIRRAGSSKDFTTLDSQKRILDPQDLVVADDSKVLALAGTMGGEESEISPNTIAISLESARFDPVSIAKNSRRHKLSTEASRRLERGVDPSLAQYASARAAELLVTVGGAKYLGTSSAGEPKYPAVIDFDPQYVSRVLGLEVKPNVVKEKLEIIGCDVDEVSWKVDPPSWRSDLIAAWDLVEEVARMIGYDSIPSVLPPRPLHASLTPSQKRKRLISQTLAARGFNEVQTFPFVNEETVAQMGYVGDRAKSYRIANPMSEDAPLLRTHLLPGLAAVAQRNIGRGIKNFAIFEIGSIFRNTQDLISGINPEIGVRPDPQTIESIFESVPPQLTHLGAILVGDISQSSWKQKSRTYEWSDALGFVEDILEICGLNWTIERSQFAPWHPGRCAEFIVDGKPVAHAGELHPRVVAQFSLPPRSCAFVINLDALPMSQVVKAQEIKVMPAAIQDVALLVDEKTSSLSVESALRSGAGELLESIVLFDRYDQIGDQKISLGFTLTFRASDRTLTGSEISAAREAAVLRAMNDCGAILRTI